MVPTIEAARSSPAAACWRSAGSATSGWAAAKARTLASSVAEAGVAASNALAVASSTGDAPLVEPSRSTVDPERMEASSAAAFTAAAARCAPVTAVARSTVALVAPACSALVARAAPLWAAALRAAVHRVTVAMVNGSKRTEGPGGGASPMAAPEGGRSSWGEVRVRQSFSKSARSGAGGSVMAGMVRGVAAENHPPMSIQGRAVRPCAEAKDLDEARAIAARIPGAADGSIEVRPVWKM